jgi:GTP cyclohydrolase I
VNEAVGIRGRAAARGKTGQPHETAMTAHKSGGLQQPARNEGNPMGTPRSGGTARNGHTGHGEPRIARPTREEAEAAVRTLIRFAGDDPRREGLRDTPRRVLDAYSEFFSGYGQDPVDVLSRTFEEVHGYDDIVMVRDIRLESHCEHHMLPIVGVAHVAYLPGDRVVGISKLARVVDIFAKRLQTQETMTAQIADAIEQALRPRGVAVLVDALHQCMTIRGVHKTDASTITTRFIGRFAEEADYRDRFLRMIHGSRVAGG